MLYPPRSFTQNAKLVLKLGAGFFADAYELFVIDIVLSILKEESNNDPTGMGYNTSTNSLIASATSSGAVFGMIFFGIFGDFIGRLSGLLITGSLVAIGSLLSASSFRSDAVPLCTQLVIYQVLLGIGIGGEYPLSATMASEGSDGPVRGRIIAGAFSMQGAGLLFSSLLAFVVVKAGVSLDVAWRFLRAFGAVPALIALYFRLRMKESHKGITQQVSPVNQLEHPTEAVTGTVLSGPAADCGEASTTSTTTQPIHHVHRKYRFLQSSTYKRAIVEILHIISEHRTELLGTCLCWFFLDITFYGTGEFRHTVSGQIFPTSNGEDPVVQDSTFGLIIASIAIPGYISAVIFIDYIGHWNLQVIGFGAMATAYLVMALVIQFEPNIAWLNLTIYGLTFYFTTFGPNTTTFIIPSEIYPRAVRATCHGLSAAAGKIGAIVGTAGFSPAIDYMGLNGIMYICAGIAAAGMAATILFIDKKLVDHCSIHPREPNAAAAHEASDLSTHDSTVALPRELVK